MRYFLLILFFIVLAPFALMAEERLPEPEKPLDALCQMLFEHTPNADVVYQPGYDVSGNPVVHPDLDGGVMRETMALPDEITFDITLDQADLLGIANADVLDVENGTVGKITLSGADILFNGNKINNMDKSSLSVLCLTEE